MHGWLLNSMGHEYKTIKTKAGWLSVPWSGYSSFLIRWEDKETCLVSRLQPVSE